MYTVKIKHSGFTILEALIYIALFGFIMGSMVISAYQIFEGSAQAQAMAEREVELNFLLRKFAWALNGATLVSVPTSDVLRVLHDDEIYDFASSDGMVTLTFNGESYALTSSRLEITDLSFELTDADRDVLAITMDINGHAVGPITRFIR